MEQVLGLLQPLGIRFLVQRSVMSSFLAIMQKTEPAGPLVRCVFWRPIRTRGRPACISPVRAWLRGCVRAAVCVRFPVVGSRPRTARPQFAQLSHSTPMTVRHLDTPSHGQCQVRSLTGAVHLQNNNGGVQRSAQCGQKPHAEHKDKSWLDLDVQYILRQRKLGLTILLV